MGDRSKFTIHNGLECDSVSGAITCSVDFDFSEIPTVAGNPITDAFVQQPAIADLTDNTGGTPANSVEDVTVTPTASIAGVDTVDAADTLAAIQALEAALVVANDNIASLNDQLVTINAALLAAGLTA